MRALFKPKTDIDIAYDMHIIGELLMIAKESYVDYTYTDLSNGMTLVSPTQREGYIIYVKSSDLDYYGNNSMLKISIRLVTICYHKKTVLRCKIDIYPTDEDHACHDMKYYAYVPLKKKTKFEMKKDFNNKVGYSIYVNDKILGICSEYGEYAQYHDDAEGLIHFFPEDHDALIKNKKDVSIDSGDFAKYEQLMRGSFPDYTGPLDCIYKMNIIGASNTQRVDFATKKRNQNTGEEEFFIIRHSTEEKISIDGNPYEIHKVDPTRFHYSQGHLFRHHKYKNVFDNNHRFTKNVLNLIRGFTISTESLGTHANAIDFVSCIVINGEVIEAL